MQGYMTGNSQFPAHRRAKSKPITLAVDLEDGSMVVIVVKQTGEVGLMALDLGMEETIDDLHIVARYDSAGDYEIESLGVMHLEAEALIHTLAAGGEIETLTYEEADDGE